MRARTKATMTRVSPLLMVLVLVACGDSNGTASGVESGGTGGGAGGAGNAGGGTSGTGSPVGLGASGGAGGGGGTGGSGGTGGDAAGSGGGGAGGPGGGAAGSGGSGGAGGSAADCDLDCEAGSTCELVQVQCFAPPCPPQPTCMPVGGSAGSGAGQTCGTRGARPCPSGQYCAYPETADCGRADAPGACADQPMACTREYNPVCGCDGQEYGNSCSAAAAGVSIDYAGPCT